MLSCLVIGAQDCGFTLSGLVNDQSTNEPLSYANIVIQETKAGAVTNDDGEFVFDGLCANHYHIHISHLGCEPQILHIDLVSDTTLQIILDHTSIALGEVVVGAKSHVTATQASNYVGKQMLDDNLNESLSDLIADIAGVQMIRNGAGISKPIVHGMFGNRLTILNNGVPQSGQQWGIDHSPEIDPNVAQSITVIKGVQSLEYGNANLGSVVLVQPKSIGREPHLHGGVTTLLESNGLGLNINARLQQYTGKFAWRLTGTYKNYGDSNTPDYYLRNTGLREANMALQVEKSWKDKVFSEVYISHFSTRLGVLRGSHISSTTDLASALSRDTPFYTEEKFSRRLDAPNQVVDHQLAKWNTKYYFDTEDHVELTLALQRNNRKEFDIRRGDRTDKPSLNILQYNTFCDLKYYKVLNQEWSMKIGSTTSLTNNQNQPGTGITPLIPDYFASRAGAYALFNWSSAKFNVELGSRYDYEFQNIAKFSNTVPKELLRFKNNFHNVSGLLGLSYQLSDNQSLLLNTGLGMRNPAINELYSFGLHQGVSGIEEGESGLNSETALKSSIEYKIWSGVGFSLDIMGYYQRFWDYIYLLPTGETRLTIRGAFPVFRYTQTDAGIVGLDFNSQFSIGNAWIATLNYSYIKGTDVTFNQPLVFMPSNNAIAGLTYQFKQSPKLGKTRFENLEVSSQFDYTFKQHNLLESQDFALPPDGYLLTDIVLSGNIILSKVQLRCNLKVTNAFNTVYRDYLNRQRYFADDLGRSIQAGVNIKF